ncbi:unnamed protein product [Protopolystoma xenopodis]|uniref:Uncharacterized protein n=1 Tax=Protopolystoma xenopodis TaxID=117903 RepID=A0A3S5AMX5_9PLAT|nr:unnamed protein product [Protopolystoma xenopodis]
MQSEEEGRTLTVIACGCEQKGLETHLFVADCLGGVSVWRIDDYCLNGRESNCPTREFTLKTLKQLCHALYFHILV